MDDTQAKTVPIAPNPTIAIRDILLSLSALRRMTTISAYKGWTNVFVWRCRQRVASNKESLMFHADGQFQGAVGFGEKMIAISAQSCYNIRIQGYPHAI